VFKTKLRAVTLRRKLGMLFGSVVMAAIPLAALGVVEIGAAGPAAAQPKTEAKLVKQLKQEVAVALTTESKLVQKDESFGR
jgi:hypothetical protein